MDIAKHWKTIFDTLQDGIIIIDTKGCIIAVNKGTERLTGYKSEELVGKSCRILNCTGCKIFDKEEDEFCGLFVKGKSKAKQCIVSKKNNRSVHILKTASVMYDENGNSIGAVEILTDISDDIRRENELTLLKRSMDLENGYHDLLGKSATMKKMFELIENVAKSEAPVMIRGESGTGKELVAIAIHEASLRRDKSFIKVNCAALNENLLESELFGHAKGAYTGADKDRIGRFEAAHEGSIFLDEIGDIPLSTQVKLLRVLEENVIERVGDHQPIPIDVRIITATNKNLEELIEKKIFREDLYFRINVFPLLCPSLHERLEDIPLLVENFIKHSTMKNKKNILGLTPKAMEVLTSYPWPGNVRELRNAIEYATVLCNEGFIEVEYLPAHIVKSQPGLTSSRTNSPNDQQKEKDLLIQTLRQTNGNQSEAARVLKVSRVTIWKRMKKHRINYRKELE